MALVNIDTTSRRDLLKQIALAVTAYTVGQMPLEAGQHVHQHATEEKKSTGAYTPKLLNEHEYKTLSRLAELVIPADEVSGSALDAGAPEFIDLLSSQNQRLADIYTGGLAWLDSLTRSRYQTTFLEAGAGRQTALLEEFVKAETQRDERRREGTTYATSEYLDFRNYGVYRDTDLGPGIMFFRWVRRMTVDAFYTSPIGVKDLGYVGNGAMSKYTVPQEAIDYALRRSPFA